MHSIITAILKSTVGFLCGFARDCAAEKLKDGGLADEHLREIIVQDLTDIKSKLDCLSLKDLDSSYSFLKDGVILLSLALDKSNEDQESSQGVVDEATRVGKVTASGILRAALSLPEAIERLKISSRERFVSAKDCFKASRERATDAFNNKSLSIKDRIMACKLRVAARILEIGLEDPVAANASCLLSLKELHDLPAVREMFSVFLKGGLKSMFMRAERLDNIMSVLFTNYALYDFAMKYGSKYPNAFAWPGIDLADRQFNPILNVSDILMSHDGNAVQQQLSRLTEVGSAYFAVNSRCEIISLYDTKFTIFNPSTGESEEVTLAETTKSNSKGKEIAVDSEDNVYILMSRSKYDVVSSAIKLKNRLLVLYVFKSDHDLKYKSVLGTFDEDETIEVNVAVDKDKNIVMTKFGDRNVSVFDSTGQLKCKFKRDDNTLCSLSISNANDIMISSRERRAVRIYSTEGNLKTTINLPEDHEVIHLAYHHGIRRIIVWTNYVKNEFEALLCYSDAGKLEHTVYSTVGDVLLRRITGHPSGTFAVMWDDTVTLI